MVALLPSEIWRQIFHAACQSYLKTIKATDILRQYHVRRWLAYMAGLCLVSKRSLQPARQALYERLILDWKTDGERLAEIYRFLHSQNLLATVKLLSVEACTDSVRASLEGMLPHCTNLQHLVFHSSGWAKGHLFQSITKLGRLQTFRYLAAESDSSLSSHAKNFQDLARNTPLQAIYIGTGTDFSYIEEPFSAALVEQNANKSKNRGLAMLSVALSTEAGPPELNKLLSSLGKTLRILSVSNFAEDEDVIVFVEVGGNGGLRQFQNSELFSKKLTPHLKELHIGFHLLFDVAFVKQLPPKLVSLTFSEQAAHASIECLSALATALDDPKCLPHLCELSFHTIDVESLCTSDEETEASLDSEAEREPSVTPLARLRASCSHREITFFEDLE